MRNQGVSRIEERLIEDALTEHIDRVDDTRDLWPGIRDRLSQRRRTRFPVITRVVAATGVVALLALLVIVRPWSLFDDSLSPFAAVAHAYEGLFELETVRYQIDGTNSTGNEFKQHHQVDMVNRIEYYVLDSKLPKLSDSDPDHTLQQEFLIINGKQYARDPVTTYSGFVPEVSTSEPSNGGWRPFFTDPERRLKERYAWVPFGEFGGLPWNRENAEEPFDSVELVGGTKVNGQPVVHYRATRKFVSEEEGDLRPNVYYIDGKRLETVHSEVEYYLTAIDTVDLWVTEDRQRIIKADHIHIERGSPLPADYKDRDWCEGLGEFTNAEYFYLSTSQSPNVQMPFRYPIDSDSHQLAGVTCWNEEETEGRIVWGRNIPEQTGEDFWVRWVYTFTAFNEPLDLPEDMPE